MKYIAYGSNMVQEQMAYRCPDANSKTISPHRHTNTAAFWSRKAAFIVSF